MPNRIFRESLKTSPNFNRLNWFEQALCIRLLLSADDLGRFHAEPEIVRAICFPLNLDSVSHQDVADGLDALDAQEMILRYEVRDRSYLEFRTWSRHQVVRSATSKHPDRNGRTRADQARAAAEARWSADADNRNADADNRIADADNRIADADNRIADADNRIIENNTVVNNRNNADADNRIADVNTRNADVLRAPPRARPCVAVGVGDGVEDAVPPYPPTETDGEKTLPEPAGPEPEKALPSELQTAVEDAVEIVLGKPGWKLSEQRTRAIIGEPVLGWWRAAKGDPILRPYPGDVTGVADDFRNQAEHATEGALRAFVANRQQARFRGGGMNEGVTDEQAEAECRRTARMIAKIYGSPPPGMSV